ncbi:molybdate ABC transporter substrate-binding protein [Pseudorhodoferax sp. Leaf267]|uniref:molybdate ABC transporter substrate-binding protein n=1 Tax=Pseudorhodoferax sp. Leaf267 TaxID=1736316 RepID=UPI000700BF92|nr:molybdate ABC transporter substrate-binding protein [Pseudorhodoferax sp. Leaf267]KQP23106.1 molybdate ABC transporter substrate-binding protein [Pseudorhodoferax sp. Leaf267]
MRVFAVASLVIALALPVAAWSQQITVSAAASLTDAFKELAPRFEAAKPGASVRLNFAASGVLLQQISQGAPVDVFASADQETMNRADTQKLIDAGSRRNFVTNSLVLIEPVQGGVGVKGLQDLGGAAVKKIAIGKTATVPVGRYTKEVLDPANLWATLEPKFVQADSVRQVLDYVSRGEVEAGFVYRTDAALMGERVKVVASPQGATPVSYPIAVVADSRRKALAADFIAYVQSEAGQRVLGRYGFGQP